MTHALAFAAGLLAGLYGGAYLLNLVLPEKVEAANGGSTDGGPTWLVTTAAS